LVEQHAQEQAVVAGGAVQPPSPRTVAGSVAGFFCSVNLPSSPRWFTATTRGYFACGTR
jgi:hypothetical protein